MYGKNYNFLDENAMIAEEQAYSPSQAAKGFLAIFGAVIAVACVMSFLSKKKEVSHREW